MKIYPGSPAKEASLQPCDDIILLTNNTPVTSIPLPWHFPAPMKWTSGVSLMMRYEMCLWFQWHGMAQGWWVALWDESELKARVIALCMLRMFLWKGLGKSWDWLGCWDTGWGVSEWRSTWEIGVVVVLLLIYGAGGFWESVVTLSWNALLWKWVAKAARKQSTVSLMVYSSATERGKWLMCFHEVRWYDWILWCIALTDS